MHPEVARLLADRGTDPDVDRLLEGVAFLCGRIRQKLDDDLPELTHGLLGLLWPHYLRPIPSMSILELLPDLKGMQAPTEAPAGAEFASAPVNGTACRYRSAWATTLRPWRLAAAQLDTAAAQPVRLTLRFETAGKAPLEALNLDSVRLHLAGEARSAFLLYLLLSAQVEQAVVSDGSGRHDAPEWALPEGSIVPAGLDRDEGVLPHPLQSFAGYRMLLEYFAFKERFLFVDLRGLSTAVRRLKLSNVLQLAITFRPPRQETFPQVTRDNIRLHCVPIVNLFPHPAEPIRLRHDRSRYLVQPARTGLADRRHAEVYSVDRVQGLLRTEALRTREFQSFFGFEHGGRPDPREATYYQTHIVPSVVAGDLADGTDTYVSFVVGTAAGEMPEEETISMDLTCTNRRLVNELSAGDITHATDRSPPGVAFRNLIKPTGTVAPPLGRGMLWRLLSHLSLNYLSLGEAGRLRQLLGLYDFQAAHDAQIAAARQRLLDGILSLRTRHGERMVRGAPLRGNLMDLELQEDRFAGEGDAYLFSAVLERFFALYVTVNSYSELRVRFAKSGKEYKFAPRWGEQFIPAVREA